MSKKTCFMIFVLMTVMLIAAFMFKITAVTVPTNSIFASMKNPYLAGASVILALLLNKNKHYWLIMIACALIFALAWQMVMVGGSLTLLPIVYKMSAFLVYAYLITLIRFMI